MATKKQTIEVTTCDFCHKQSCHEKCLGCGKDACWECQKTAGTSYQFAVHLSGGDDGFYCKECDDRLTRARDPRLMAYKRIQSLRRELEGFHADFKKRTEEAEKHLNTFTK